MVKYTKTIVLLLFILAAGWLITFPTASSGTAAAEAASPKSLYIQHCSSCHGANGKAETARGRKLEAYDLTSEDIQAMSTERIIRAITNGRVGMPGFKKKLSSQQIAQIAGYVHTF